MLVPQAPGARPAAGGTHTLGGVSRAGGREATGALWLAGGRAGRPPTYCSTILGHELHSTNGPATAGEQVELRQRQGTTHHTPVAAAAAAAAG